jgi:hypothetical protein
MKGADGVYGTTVLTPALSSRRGRIRCRVLGNTGGWIRAIRIHKTHSCPPLSLLPGEKVRMRAGF